MTSPVAHERYSRARYSVTSTSFSLKSTCWIVRNSSVATHSGPNGSPVHSQTLVRSTSSGGNEGRRCRGCPGCPPRRRFRRLPPAAAGRGGFTMSLDGGLEEVEE